MPDSEPIRHYLDAVESLGAGDKDGAAESLTRAIGGQKPSSVIRHSVKKMLTQGTYINRLIIELVASTVTRRRRL